MPNSESSQGLRSVFLIGGLGTLSIKISGTLFSLLVTILLARSMGPESYGIYALVLAIVTLLAIPVCAGLPQLIIRETAVSSSNEEWGRVKGLWLWATGWVLLFSAILALMVCVAAAFIIDNSALSNALRLGLVLVPLMSVLGIWVGALQGLNKVLLGQAAEGVIHPVVLPAPLGVIITPKTTSSLLMPSEAIILYAASVLAAIVFSGLVIRSVAPIELRASTANYEPIYWFKNAIPFALVSGIGYINSQADIIILGFFVPTEDIGIYRVASQGAMVSVLALVAFNAAMAPRVSRLFAEGRMLQLQSMVQTSVVLISGLTLTVALTFIMFGDHVLGVVFGEAYKRAWMALGILCAGQIVNALVGSVALLLNMTGHQARTAKWVALAAFVNVCLNFCFIPWLGLTGAALATATSNVIWNFLLWREVRRLLRIEPSILALFRPKAFSG